MVNSAKAALIEPDGCGNRGISSFLPKGKRELFLGGGDEFGVYN